MAGRRLARVRLKSLAFATDVAIRSMEGATVSPRDGYLVVRTPDNPSFWWGNFLLLAEPPEPGSAGRWLARFAAEFPGARHVALGVDTADGAVVVPDDFIDAGLEPERCVALTATGLREPRHVNREVQIRPLGSGDDWQQTVDLAMLVWSAGRYGLDQLGAHTLVIVADPAEEPIRLYRSVGFADAEGQLSLCRPPAPFAAAGTAAGRGPA